MNGIRWRLAWLWSELQAHGEAYLRNWSKPGSQWGSVAK